MEFPSPPSNSTHSYEDSLEANVIALGPAHIFLKNYSGTEDMGEDKTSAKNWFQAFPYRFIVQKNDDDFYIYSLPIPPEQIITKPIYASDAVATMGGVIEECSSVTFWQIMMSGLMPLAVNRNSYKVPATEFRETINSVGLLTGIASSLLGPAQSALSTISNVSNATSISEGLNAVLNPPLVYSESAVNQENNGYSEIYDMQRFFLAYERVKSRQDIKSNETYTLFFENVKDNQRFRVIPKQTDFMKTAKTPFGYRYQIALQGWKLADVSAENVSDLAQNRFKTDLKTVSTLTATQILNAAKNVLKTFKKIKSGDLSPFGTLPPVV